MTRRRDDYPIFRDEKYYTILRCMNKFKEKYESPDFYEDVLKEYNRTAKSSGKKLGMPEVIRMVKELRRVYESENEIAGIQNNLCTNERSSPKETTRRGNFFYLLKEIFNSPSDREDSPSDVSTGSIFRDTDSMDEACENKDRTLPDHKDSTSNKKSEIEDNLEDHMYGLPMESVLSRLYEENQKMRQFYLDQESQYQQEKKAYEELKEEYKSLKSECKTLKHRQKEEKRIKRTLFSDNNNTMQKQDRRRLRKFRSEVSLRLQLLESESKRFEMKIEKQVSDLRREYADSYLFANPFPETDPN